MRRVEGGKWRERVVGKAAGIERVFIAGRGSGLQIKLAQTPAAGGEWDHGRLNRMA
jgi:hypothetical protein